MIRSLFSSQRTMDVDQSTDMLHLENLLNSSFSNYVQNSSVTLPNASLEPSIGIATTKIHQLQAEIEAVNQSPIAVLETSDDSRHEILQNELEKSVAQLQETLSFVRSQRKELADDIDKETEIQHQLENVVAAVKERLNQSDGKNTMSESTLMLDLQRKKERIEQHCREMRRSLTAFINEHFPLPSEENISEAKSKLRSANNQHTTGYMISLKRILEDLINKSLEDPNDPYIDIDGTFWPPYIELLLRCQIVIRHQDDQNKIKLVPFHL